jgi:ABC-type multidrug transport system permease subunit
MSLIWTLAKKELLLLLRDRLALILLLVTPLVFILILGLLLGEGFGQASDDKLRITIVDLDAGEGGGLEGTKWAKVVQRDLAETADIKVERLTLGSEAEDLAHADELMRQAEELIRDHKRAAILVFKPNFSERMRLCSFTADGINPFHRDGVYLHHVGAELLKDSTQSAGASIIEQVAQVSMLRVILPYMIGRAFEKLSEPEFIALLGRAVNLPVPPSQQFLLSAMRPKPPAAIGGAVGPTMRQLYRPDRLSLGEMLYLAAEKNPTKEREYRGKVGAGVQEALGKQFKNYNLRGKTWADLTKSKASGREGAGSYEYVNRDGAGFLKRGAHRYQVLVPSYAVMFAFFLALIVGWVFVAERRQGTLKRLRAAPVTRGHVLLGKMLPCYVLSVGQGLFLMVMGRLLFGMRWGPDGWPLWQQTAFILAVVLTTSLAVMGLAMLVAAVARSEIQVALLGAVAVLVLALVGGCVLPRDMMPEETQKISLVTPHGWALDAYRELLNADPNYQPNLAIVGRACAVLSGFGLVFLAGAWGLLRLD